VIVEGRIFGLAAVLALSGSWLLSAATTTTPTPAESTATVMIAAPQQPAAARASGQVLAASPAPQAVADRSRRLELPDGSTVPTLNGAVDAAPLRHYWGSFPWSPIVATERSDAGLDWYRHADGSYSTTQMVWRSDLGRMAAMTRVGHPGPTPAATAPPR
jgi:hypothetical protein